MAKIAEESMEYTSASPPDRLNHTSSEDTTTLLFTEIWKEASLTPGLKTSTLGATDMPGVAEVMVILTLFAGALLTVTENGRLVLPLGTEDRAGTWNLYL